MADHFFCVLISPKASQAFIANHLPNREQIDDDAVAETARLTETSPELDEQEQRAINERLAHVAEHSDKQPQVCIRYFVPDERKSGGAIVEVSGIVKKLSDADATVTLADGCKIRLSDIVDLSIG